MLEASDKIRRGLWSRVLEVGAWSEIDSTTEEAALSSLKRLEDKILLVSKEYSQREKRHHCSECGSSFQLCSSLVRHFESDGHIRKLEAAGRLKRGLWQHMARSGLRRLPKLARIDCTSEETVLDSLKRIQEEEGFKGDNEDPDSFCIICQDSLMDAVFVPCGHTAPALNARRGCRDCRASARCAGRG